MKYLYQILLISSLTAAQFNAGAQAPGGCGTEVSPQGYQLYRSLVKQADANNQSDFSPQMAPIQVPVHFHIIRRNDGTGYNGLSVEDQLAECDAALDTVNQRYKVADIQFYRCLEPNIIMNDVFFDSINVGSASQQAFMAANFNPSVINVYFSSRVLSSTGSNRCGWARFPTDAERWVIMNYGCLDDRNTFAHEMGHYFGLLHTHEDFMGAENVTRDAGNPCYDCATQGDLLCDTPADPTLQLNNGSFIVNAMCNYTGTAMDACGVAYTPDTRNVMSYTTGACGGHFSPGQVAVAIQAYNNTRQAQLDPSVCNQSPCFEDVVLPNNTITAAKKVNAQKTISSREIIMTPPSDDVVYDAGSAIHLLPGFHAKSGARFHALLEGCYIPPFAPGSSDDRTAQPVSTQQKTTALQVMPNPTTGLTTVIFQCSEQQDATIRLLDMQGRLVEEWSFKAGITNRSLQFDAAKMAPGLYFCTLMSEQDLVTQKVLVSK